jgi:signal transduction histidine kinase
MQIEIWRSIRGYLKKQKLLLLILLIYHGAVISTALLSHLSMGLLVNALLLPGFFSLILIVGDALRYIRWHNTLRSQMQGMQKRKGNPEIPLIGLSHLESYDLIEKDYQEIIHLIEQQFNSLQQQWDKSYKDMVDYYSLWVHQIKIPIAAIDLVLQTGDDRNPEQLRQELFKIEQYVEMVLCYLRMETMSQDLLLKEYPLEEMVKKAIRKYASMFIHKKLSVKLDDLSGKVLTDEKWLLFVIEQVLSNAIKYTKSGGIHIYMDPDQEATLVIEDSGIGIREEDIPRVFERGFTGYNGRFDQRSTGIGLYLCKEILQRLSHSIAIESEVGKGTSVHISLQTKRIDMD